MKLSLEAAKRDPKLDQDDPKEDLNIYDSALVQFFFSWLKRIFIDPEDMIDCMALGDHMIARAIAIDSIHEIFSFLRTKAPEMLRTLQQTIADLKPVSYKIDKRPLILFDDLLPIIIKYFAYEREAFSSTASKKAQTKAKGVLQRLFKEAKQGLLAFKMKHLGRLQKAFEKYDEIHNGADTRGAYTYAEFYELVKHGLGFDKVDDNKIMELFNKWHNAVDEEIGWEMYLDEHDALSSEKDAMEHFKRLTAKVKEEAYNMDDRSEETKRRSILVSKNMLGNAVNEKKMNFLAWKKAAGKMKTVFFQNAFTSVDYEMGHKLEVSRGLLGSKVAFSKVMYDANLFIENENLERILSKQKSYGLSTDDEVSSEEDDFFG